MKQNEDLPSISVIVPVYNNTKQLVDCVSALNLQSYPAHLFEIIVVDNGSTENIQSAISAFPKITYLQECKPGSYMARNSGIKIAKGDLLAFTDSDCIPQDDWLEKGVATLLTNEEIGLVGGEVKMEIEHPGKATVVEIYQLICGFNQKKLVQERHFGVTANLFTRKSVLNTVGDFNTQLKSGGDLEWGRRVFIKGYLQKYDENAIVIHPVRTSLLSLVLQARRVAGGRYNMQKINDSYLRLSEVSKPVSSISNSIKTLWQDTLADTYWTKIGLLLIGIILRSVMLLESISLKYGLSAAKR